MTVASDDTSKATVIPATLTFTATDWADGQPVTVTGVDDDDATDESSAVTLVSASPDSLYDGLTVSVVVGVTDDDEPGLVLSESTLIVDENGTTTFDVSLAAAPSGAVTVSVSSADTSAATISPATLTFTPTNWGTPQPVTVTGTDDGDSSGETVTVDLAASGGDYNGTTESVTVTVTDNDAPPMPPGNPEDVTLTCNSEGAVISWNPPTTGGQPDSYQVIVTFWGPGDDHTQTVSHPTTETTFALGSGYYASPGVKASNSAGENLNFELGNSESC